MSKGFQMAGGATVIALLLGWYAASTLEDGASFQYYQELRDFQGDPAAAQGRQARVHGYVALGSIERDVATKQVRFRVVNDPPHAAAAAGGAGAAGPDLEVVYASLETPDLFKDGAEVVIEGAVQGAVFQADKVMAKCPSKFAAEGDEAPAG